ncbi:MAG TPA: alpha-amylase family glycosyl hydrolase [Lachnospiraceae bacterium]|nr:alpha-amylase family glycosyl hydrolase [Lachnospiraceae bacterium]
MDQWLDSVYSDGSEHFVSNPLPEKGETITISMRVMENDKLKNVLLRTKKNGAEQLRTMRRGKVDNGLAYYSAEVTIYEEELNYQFYLVTDKQIYYYTQYRITDYIPDEIYDFRILTAYKQPSWVKGGVFYQIFPDRFYNGNPENDVRNGEYTFQGHDTIHVDNWNEEPKEYYESFGLDFYGGDLEGITKKIPYLKKLGVTALYLNPIFRAATVHKYDCIDYFHVDEHFGGDEALEELSKELHRNGMKLILDISINHTGSAHAWFNKDVSFFPKTEGAFYNTTAKEREYYFIHEDQSYDSWVGVPTLPMLNYTSMELRDIIYKGQDSVIKKWLKEPFSIDGWRFDVADVFARNNKLQLNHELWPQIRSSIKEENEKAYVVAEDWSDCTEYLKGNEWDSPMNYFGCARPIREFLGEEDLFHMRKEELRGIPTRMTARNLHQRIIQYLGKLPYVMQEISFNLFDSHDVSRLHNNSKVSFDDYRAAVILLFTLPGTPSIYYGDEIGIGGRIDSNEGCRYPMKWEDGCEDTKYYKLYNTLANLRSQMESLRNGGLKFLSDEGYVLSYVRVGRSNNVFVICSVDDECRKVRIPFKHYGYREEAVISETFGRAINHHVEGNTFSIVVPPHTSYVLTISN